MMRSVSIVVCCALCAAGVCAQDAESFQDEIAEKAKGLAEGRHAFMEAFLREWDAETKTGDEA